MTTIFGRLLIIDYSSSKIISHKYAPGVKDAVAKLDVVVRERVCKSAF